MIESAASTLSVHITYFCPSAHVHIVHPNLQKKTAHCDVAYCSATQPVRVIKWAFQPIITRRCIHHFSQQKQCNITLTRGGMYWKLRPPRTERFAEVLILHPEAREIARGRSPRAISRAEGCKINAEANLEVRGGRNFQWIPTLVSVITFFFPRRGCFDFSFWPAHCVL